MLTQEDLQAIRSLIQEENKSIREDIKELKREVSKMQDDIAEMKEDIEVIREDTEITRGATNELLEWFDTYHRDGNTPFPVDRKTFLGNM